MVTWLNALPVQTSPAQGSCFLGLFDDSYPVFTFHTPAGTVVFSDEICHQVKVTVNGPRRPTLSEGGGGDFYATSDGFMRDTLQALSRRDS